MEDQDKLLEKIRSKQTEKPKESVSVDLISPVKSNGGYNSDVGDDVCTDSNNIGKDDSASTSSDDSINKKPNNRVSRVTHNKS